jgi:glycerophosphoryl diester phosphodiesterase
VFLARHGISAVEFDVCRISDGRSVVAHPSSIDKGTSDSAIPFERFLEACRALDVDMFIDVKLIGGKLDEELPESLVQAVTKADCSDRVVVISRSEELLSRFRGTLLTGHIMSEIRSQSTCSCDMLLVPLARLSNDTVLAQTRGKKLVATQVAVSDIGLVQHHKLKDIMTDHAIEIAQALRRSIRSIPQERPSDPGNEDLAGSGNLARRQSWSDTSHRITAPKL